MSFNIELPIDLWREVALTCAAAYFILIQTMRGISINIKDAKRKFLIRISIESGYYTSLPNGRLHSIDDQPAMCTDVFCKWYNEGNIHREKDYPAVLEANGTQMWYRNGKLHRENDRPAVDNDIGLFWYRNGLLHRIGGPAILLKDGNVFWYEYGIQIRHRAHGWLFQSG